MRYNDWDVLLFPGDSIVPIKEFRVDCHLVHDIEFSSSNGSTGLPTMTCFVPSLDAGAPFQISIHSWRGQPEVSQFTKAFSKHAELVQFEARVFIDGFFVASAILDPMGTWPCQICNTFDLTKNGDLDTLRFPVFLYDILQQRGWSPADDLGRIKLIVSEGFPRGSVTVPVERVKNVAAFAFQHAPLSILEAAGLAWPNPSLWLHSPVPSSKPVPIYSSNDGPLLHGHSPRRPKHKPAAANERGLGSGIPSHGNQLWSGIESHPGAASRNGLAHNSGQAGRARRAYRTPPPPLDWMHHNAQHEKPPYLQGSRENSAGQQNSTSDTSMPDYLGIPQDGQGSWSYFNPKCQSNDFTGSDSNGILPTLFNKAPANTPASTSTDDSSTPGKRNPYLRHNALGSHPRAPAPGFMDMMHQSMMGQPVNTPNLARDIPLPPSLASSVVGRRACVHIQDGELMCSDRSCHSTPQSTKGGFMGHRIFSQPFMDTGMEGRSSSLIHFGAGGPGLADVGPDTARTDSGGTSSGCGSNQTGSGGADVRFNRLSLDSTNVTPAHGQAHAPGSKVLSSNPADSVELTDEAIMQALAQA